MPTPLSAGHRQAPLQLQEAEALDVVVGRAHPGPDVRPADREAVAADVERPLLAGGPPDCRREAEGPGGNRLAGVLNIEN